MPRRARPTRGRCAPRLILTVVILTMADPRQASPAPCAACCAYYGCIHYGCTHFGCTNTHHGYTYSGCTNTHHGYTCTGCTNTHHGYTYYGRAAIGLGPRLLQHGADPNSNPNPSSNPNQDSALAFSNTELLGIRSVAGEARLFNLLVNSLSPAIFGHEIVKVGPPYT